MATCGAVLTVIAVASGCAAGGNSASAFKTGACVVVGLDSTGNGTISGVSCTNPPADFDKVVAVEDGSSAACTTGDRTFQDQATGKTYCLEDLYNMAAGSGANSNSNSSPAAQNAAPSATPSQSTGFAFDFCRPAWKPLEQMNAAVQKGQVDQYGEMTWPNGAWPDAQTIATWNQVLDALSQQATAAGQSELASDAFQGKMQPGYNPQSDNGNGAIALGNETLNIAVACAPGGQQTGQSTISTYTSYDGFTWRPGN
jgi:hypothetical protein